MALLGVAALPALLALLVPAELLLVLVVLLLVLVPVLPHRQGGLRHPPTSIFPLMLRVLAALWRLPMQQPHQLLALMARQH